MGWKDIKRKFSRKSSATSESVGDAARDTGRTISKVASASSDVAAGPGRKVGQFQRSRGRRSDARSLNEYDDGDYENTISPQLDELGSSLSSLKSELKSATSNAESSEKAVSKDVKYLKKDIGRFEDSIVSEANTEAKERIRKIKEELNDAKNTARERVDSILNTLDSKKGERVEGIRKLASTLKAKQKELSRLEESFKDCNKWLSPDYKSGDKINQQEWCYDELQRVIDEAKRIQQDITEAMREFYEIPQMDFPDEIPNESGLFKNPQLPAALRDPDNLSKLQQLGTKTLPEFNSVDFPNRFNLPQTRSRGVRGRAEPEDESETTASRIAAASAVSVPTGDVTTFESTDPMGHIEGTDTGATDVGATDVGATDVGTVDVGQTGGGLYRSIYHINKNCYHDLMLMDIANDLIY